MFEAVSDLQGFVWRVVICIYVCACLCKGWNTVTRVCIFSITTTTAPRDSPYDPCTCRDSHKFGTCISCMGCVPMQLIQMLNLCASTVMFAYSNPRLTCLAFLLLAWVAYPCHFYKCQTCEQSRMLTSFGAVSTGGPPRRL